MWCSFALMQNQAQRLDARRGEIDRRLADIGVPKANTTGAREQPALWLERAIIEQTLAQLAATEALQRDTSEREAERAGRDDAAFWRRRFSTSLAIGNGAGFAVVTAGILQSPHLDQALVFAWEFMFLFGLGVVLAGGLPLVLWAQRQFPKAGPAMHLLAVLVTTMSAGAFALAIGTAVYRVNAAQPSAGKVARAEREVEGVELAQKWRALHPPPQGNQ